MNTAVQRKDAYAAKNVAATVALKVASRLSGMKTGFGVAVQSLVPIEIQVQGILNTNGTIPTIQYPFYLNFARQIWSKQFAGIEGVSLTFQAQALKDFYVVKGLTSSVLIAIAMSCFTVVVT